MLHLDFWHLGCLFCAEATSDSLDSVGVTSKRHSWALRPSCAHTFCSSSNRSSPRVSPPRRPRQWRPIVRVRWVPHVDVEEDFGVFRTVPSPFNTSSTRVYILQCPQETPSSFLRCLLPEMQQSEMTCDVSTLPAHPPQCKLAFPHDISSREKRLHISPPTLRAPEALVPDRSRIRLASAFFALLTLGWGDGGTYFFSDEQHRLTHGIQSPELYCLVGAFSCQAPTPTHPSVTRFRT